ncbi:uncharacterized protein LACBIDRAFT_329384 [Laccaria bicolor S238N-H82]|uniref:Predicted protein n=1 Tax=Laccaria bicolor (strain S238N-H82 / ATCC MYA-4686) TaxID=486041 RepID=B0DHV1_LACBS|nr:uncharacterized protein LACBIDRAFT_329384 [Laccaria bicolor S238N-H82]EDR05897.1 predicted protein [Laccaria bicolor S238N-H82]|eukprot:XP_001883573.1 predicted protein [Laccaria bicolor S238N-H82]
MAALQTQLPVRASAVLLTLAKTGDIVQLLALATVILAFSALVSLAFYSTSYGLLDNSTYCALVLNDAIKPKRSCCECPGSRKRFVFLSLVASQLQAIGGS